MLFVCGPGSLVLPVRPSSPWKVGHGGSPPARDCKPGESCAGTESPANMEIDNNKTNPIACTFMESSFRKEQMVKTLV